MRHLDLSVHGVDCRRCIRDLTARLRDVPGVQVVTIDPARKHVRLTGSMTAADALTALADTRYRPQVVEPTGAPTPKATASQAAHHDEEHPP